MEKKMENVFLFSQGEKEKEKEEKEEEELKELLESFEFIKDLQSQSLEDNKFFIKFWHQFFFFDNNEKKKIQDYHTILFRHAFSTAFKKLLDKIDCQFSNQELEFLKLYIDHLRVEKKRKEYMYNFLYDFCTSSPSSRARPEYFMGLIHGTIIDKQSTIEFLRFVLSILPFQSGSIPHTVKDLFFMCFQGTSEKKVIEKDHVTRLLYIVSPAAPTGIILRIKRPRKEQVREIEEIENYDDDVAQTAHYIRGMEEF